MPTLDFRGKSFIARHHENLPYHTIVPDPDLSVLPEGVAPSLSGNLLIEGDNLLALESLLPHFRGKIKCIYIDPPYNTGNENWVYNDNVSGALFKEWLGQEVGRQGEDFNRHDKWCCMMYPRLSLLRELLREDGLIIASIGDDEFHHLQMLMNEVFEEENHIATFTWKSRAKPINVGEAKVKPQKVAEYLIAYGIKKDTIKFNAIFSGKSRTYPHTDDNGKYRTAGILKSNRGTNKRETMTFAVDGYTPPSDQRWQAGEEVILGLYQTRHIEFREGTPFRKYYEHEELEQSDPLYTYIKEDVSETSETGKSELNAILGNQHGFDTVKPLSLLKYLLNVFTKANTDDIILDSFAGSGTTAHAVLQLNKDDGGNRRFISVQLAHDSKADQNMGRNIARDITRKRIKRVIEGVGTTLPALGGSFTYARLSAEPLRGYYGVLTPGTTWLELAGYVWQTETLTAFDPAQADQTTGLLGRTNKNDTAIYLLYTDGDEESRPLELATLHFLEAEPARTIIIYAEKLWLDPDDRKEWIDQHKKIIRERLLPTQLR